MFGLSLLGGLPRKGWVIAGVVLAVALFSLSAYGYGFGSGKAAATEKAAEKFQAYQDEVLERERAQNLLVAAANKRNTELERAYERRLSDLRSRLARENAEAAARDAAVMASLRAGSDRLRLQVTACSQDRSGGVESATAGTHGTRTADVAPEAASALWGIAGDGDRAIRKLIALQEWAREAVLLCGKQPEPGEAS